MGQPVVHFESIGGLGATRGMGPEKNPGGNLVVGHFTDPEGHLISGAGPASRAGLHAHNRDCRRRRRS